MNQAQLDVYCQTRFEWEVDLMKQAIESYDRNESKGQNNLLLKYECEVRLFNALLYLGRFDEALNYAKTREDKKTVQRLMMSLIREEKDCCKCTPEMMPDRNGYVEIPMLFKYKRIINPKTGGWVDVYKCSKCNFMTAHPYGAASQSARKLERARARPKNNNPKKPVGDLEALKQ